MLSHLPSHLPLGSSSHTLDPALSCTRAPPPRPQPPPWHMSCLIVQSPGGMKCGLCGTGPGGQQGAASEAPPPPSGEVAPISRRTTCLSSDPGWPLSRPVGSHPHSYPWHCSLEQEMDPSSCSPTGQEGGLREGFSLSYLFCLVQGNILTEGWKTVEISACRPMEQSSSEGDSQGERSLSGPSCCPCTSFQCPPQTVTPG